MNSEQKLGFFILYFTTYLSMAALVCGAILLVNSTSPGFRFLGISVIVIGAALVFILCGTCCFINGSATEERPAITFGSCCFSLPLLLAFFALMIFAFAVSCKGGGQSYFKVTYKKYHVESYSKWMQRRVSDVHNWDNYYKKAIIKKHVCSPSFGNHLTDDLKFDNHLDPFTIGCCMPPEDCGFNNTSPTVWVKPHNAKSSNDDCNRWDDDPNIFCFDCQSCKAAFLNSVSRCWFGVSLIFLLLFFVKPLFWGCLYGICISLSN